MGGIASNFNLIYAMLPVFYIKKHSFFIICYGVNTMFEVIYIVIVVFLSVIGIGELMHRIWMAIIKPNNAKNILITPLTDDCAAEQLQAVLEEVRWLGKGYAEVVIGVDFGLGNDILAKCNALQDNNPELFICSPEELPEIIKLRS